MRKKPWATTSSLPDRIPPRPSSFPSHQYGPGTGKVQAASDAAGKGPSKQPKSPEVLKLEGLVKVLHGSAGNTKDPKGGCFCLAKDHPLSPYVPICLGCGLILCTLNPPQYACPFCSTALQSSDQRRLLIADLEQKIADTLAREAEVRERAIEEAKKAAGAFPALSDSIHQPQAQHAHPKNVNQDGRPNLPPLAQETHKVVSLRSKPGSKKVFISSHTPSPAGSRPASRGPDAAAEKEKEDDVGRVPPPGPQPKHAARTPQARRPWENLLLDQNVTYIPPSTV